MTCDILGILLVHLLSIQIIVHLPIVFSNPFESTPSKDYFKTLRRFIPTHSSYTTVSYILEPYTRSLKPICYVFVFAKYDTISMWAWFAADNKSQRVINDLYIYDIAGQRKQHGGMDKLVEHSVEAS